MRILLLGLLLLGVSCTKDKDAPQAAEVKEAKAEAPKPAPPAVAEALKTLDKMIPAEDIKPPMISRSKVVKLKRIEAADGSGKWVADGEPVAPSGHYGEVPKDAVEGTATMKFEDGSSGDYAHLIFEGPGGSYDFGDGDNQLAGTPFEGKEGEELEEYIGKRFEVTWAFKPASFPCCEGGQDTWRGMKASIVKLEPVE